MRTIGATDHVVVVGAGLGRPVGGTAPGWSWPCGDRRRTRRRPRRTGRAARHRRLPARHTGPTVLTMPDLIDETFAAVGESTADRLELETVDPAYRALFVDGSSLDVHSDCDAMATEVERLAGPQQAQGYLGCAKAGPAVRGRIQRLHRLQLRLTTVAVDAAAGPADCARRLPPVGQGGEAVHHRSAFARIFTFQALYAGFRRSGRSRCTPSSRTWTPLRACTSHGGCGRCPTRWPRRRRRRRGIPLRRKGNGARPARRPDPGRGHRHGRAHPRRRRRPHHRTARHHRLLGRTPRRLLPLRPSPSAVVAHIGCRSVDREMPHHILFGDTWEQTFREIIDDGRDDDPLSR